MGKRRMQIEVIEDKSKRHTTFTKRRHGLFKKAQNLCELCGGEIAVIAFSKAGNAFGFGHPTVEGVVSRYLAENTSGIAVDDGVEDGERSVVPRVVKEEEPLTEMEKRIGEAMASGRPAWDEMVRNLGFRELEELEAAIKKMKSTVAAVANGKETMWQASHVVKEA